MSMGAGLGLIVAGSALGSATALGLRTRLAAAWVTSLLALAGASVGAGALLVQADASGVDWVIALAGLGILAPVHVRVVGGPFGPASDAPQQ